MIKKRGNETASEGRDGSDAVEGAIGTSPNASPSATDPTELIQPVDSLSPPAPLAASHQTGDSVSQPSAEASDASVKLENQVPVDPAATINREVAGELSFQEHLRHIGFGPPLELPYALACIHDLTKQMFNLRLRDPHQLPDWEGVALARLSLTQQVQALRACHEEELADLAEEVGRLRQALTASPATTRDLKVRIQLAEKVCQHVGCGTRRTSLRTPRATRTVNAVSVETTTGYRTFHLQHGDLLQVSTDLLIISSRTRHPDSAEGDYWLNQIRKLYDLEFDPSRILLRLGAEAWTCFQEGNPNTPFAQLLTLRAPALAHQSDPARFYDTLIGGLLASVAALEHLGYRFPRIALTALMASWVPDYRSGIDSLIRHSVRWLKKSEHTHTVQFLIYYADELLHWDSAMDTCLGRTTVSTGRHAVLEGLRRDLLNAAAPHQDGPLAGAVQPLLEALGRKDQLCIEHVCVFGRKLVELALSILLSRYGLKETPVLMTNIEALRQSGQVAPWICSYMHSLRIFGNETVHTRAPERTYLPARLSENDLLSALCALRALLDFWVVQQSAAD
jgi:hypothetical protein